MSAISTVLWSGMKKAEPTSLLGGILADKPGYHNARKRLPLSDYSVAQFAIDRQGPDSEGSAIDWTFPEAQSGDYRRISKYTNRLLTAAKNGDSRLYAVREFFGNADNDTEVEGWDVAKNRPSSSDKSHLWHLHISIHRKYINDAAAMNSLLEVINGIPRKVPMSHDEEIHATFTAIFYGGSSCGTPVPERFRVSDNSNGNAVVDKLNYLQAMLETILAR